MKKIFWNVLVIVTLYLTNTVYATDPNMSESDFIRVYHQSEMIKLDEFPENIKSCVCDIVSHQLNERTKSLYEQMEILRTQPISLEVNLYRHLQIYDRVSLRQHVDGITNDGKIDLRKNRAKSGTKIHMPLKALEQKYATLDGSTSFSSDDNKIHVGLTAWNRPQEFHVIKENRSEIKIIKKPEDVKAIYVEAISGDGCTIVGSTLKGSFVESSSRYLLRAFKWTEQESIKHLSDDDSEAKCVNSKGNIIAGRNSGYKAAIWVNDKPYNFEDFLKIKHKRFLESFHINNFDYISPAGNVFVDLVSPESAPMLVSLIKFSIN